MTVSELLRIADHLDRKDQEIVRRAYERALDAHAGQRRLSGEEYVNHPMEVAAILADLELDAETLAAALLHDTVEDTPLTAEAVEQEFGPEVARLVDGVTKLGRISLRWDQQQQAENLRKMMVAMAEDLRVVLIKLADRLHNMRTLDPLPEVKRRKISRETLDIYAPLAHRLGIGQIKWELEDLAFRNIEPDAYDDVAKRIARKRHEREALVSDLREILASELEKVGIQADITGRPKHIYSVWQKMTRDHKDITEIYDLSAMRGLLEWQTEVGDAESFVDTVKIDLFQDEVYVFTPKGDVLNLPAGSTPVDFAYRIHTEVGHRCVGAKVNGRMVPLDYDLKNGEIVEILTAKAPHGPSRDWLNFVKSASAKERIRKWFKSQRREENVAKGRDLLEKELHRMHRLALNQLPDGKLDEMAAHYKYAGGEEIGRASGRERGGVGAGV